MIYVHAGSFNISECAYAFYKAGAKLILCARREQELSRVKENLMKIPIVSTLRLMLTVTCVTA